MRDAISEAGGMCCDNRKGEVSVPLSADQGIILAFSTDMTDVVVLELAGCLGDGREVSPGTSVEKLPEWI